MRAINNIAIVNNKNRSKNVKKARRCLLVPHFPPICSLCSGVSSPSVLLHEGVGQSNQRCI